jgi:hypothetical protein
MLDLNELRRIPDKYGKLQTNLRLSPEIVKKLDQVAPSRRRSQFVEKLLAAELPKYLEVPQK